MQKYFYYLKHNVKAAVHLHFHFTAQFFSLILEGFTLKPLHMASQLKGHYGNSNGFQPTTKHISFWYFF